MRRMKKHLAVFLFGLFAISPVFGFAQEQTQEKTQEKAGWAVLVLGNPGQGAERAFADSFHVAEALRAGAIGAAMGHVALHRELGPDQIAAAIEAMAGQEQVLLYFAGSLFQKDGETILVAQDIIDHRLALPGIVSRLAASGTSRLAILLENCAGRSGQDRGQDPGQGSGQAAEVSVPANVPENMHLLVAASASASAVVACGARAGRLTDLLKAASSAPAPFDLGVALENSGMRLHSNAGPGIFLLGSEVAGIVGSDDIFVLDLPVSPPTPPISSTPAATAPEIEVLAAPVQTIISAVSSFTITAPAVNAVAGVPPGQRQGQGVAIFAPPPLAQQASLPVAAGLPEPSIIIGLLDLTNASFEVIPDEPGAITSNEVSFDNFEARQAMRASDPELFGTLVLGGAFDPPQNQLRAALQVELQRMNCYTGRIDGDWGRGSRAAVDRYFTELGEASESREASIDLFRKIISVDGVVCPAPVQAVTRAPRNTGGGGTRPAPAPAAPAAPAPAAPTPAAPTINTNALGVFR